MRAEFLLWRPLSSEGCWSSCCSSQECLGGCGFAPDVSTQLGRRSSPCPTYTTSQRWPHESGHQGPFLSKEMDTSTCTNTNTHVKVWFMVIMTGKVLHMFLFIEWIFWIVRNQLNKGLPQVLSLIFSMLLYTSTLLHFWRQICCFFLLLYNYRTAIVTLYGRSESGKHIVSLYNMVHCYRLNYPTV